MSEDDDADDRPPQPDARTKRKRFLKHLAIFVGIVALVWVVGRWQVNRVGERRLNETVRGLDAEDPGWVIADIEIARQARAPVPGRNSVTLIDAIPPLLPDAWDKWRNDAGYRWGFDPPTNHLPPADWLKGLATHAVPMIPARTLALKLREFPDGHRPFSYPDNPLALTLPHLDANRKVIDLLHHDAALASLDHDPDRGILAAHAALNGSRSIGDEPCLISQVFRMSGRQRATDIALRTLAWGTPTRGLAELQTALLEDAEEPLFLNGMRGERAAVHRLFQSLESGRVDIEDILPGCDRPPFATVLGTAYRPLLPGDHAEYLRTSTAYIEAAKLPWHEQREASRAVMPDGPSRNIGHTVTRLLLPACDHVAEGALRSRAKLLVATAALACERFRLLHDRWPYSLDELKPAFLSAIPTSPFDGRPMRYQQFPDGIGISCFCRAERYNATAGPKEFREGDTPGFAEGARLWNPEVRGLPSLPPKKDGDYQP